MGRLFDLLQRAGEAAIRPDWDEFATYYSAEVQAWSPSYDLVGLSSWLEEIQTQNAFDDIRQDLTLIAETDTTVVAEWTWSIPHPSGEGRATLPGLSYYVFEDDKITNVRQYFDLAGFMEQLQTVSA